MAHLEQFGRVSRLSYSRIKEPVELPNLIQIQKNSYDWFLEHGLREALQEVFPISDFTGNLELGFLDYSMGEPKYSINECKERDVSYQAPLKLKVRLTDKENGEIKESEVYMGDLPLMTEKGTFIINGAERVVVSQLVKSPGVYFNERMDVAGHPLFGATIIPNRGAWFELEMDSAGLVYTRIDKTRKIPVTVLLRALGYESNEVILDMYDGDETIARTLEKDTSTNKKEALIEFYRRLRPGELATEDAAEQLLKNLFFDPRRYDMAAVGRYKVNKKLGLNIPPENRHLTLEDITATIGYLLKLIKGEGKTDVIDHLGNRRLRSIGELLQNQFRTGLVRMERVVRERMSIHDVETLTPQVLINIRPITAAVKEFFGSSQLSQFMDQTNPLAELTHKRRLSALGPGGLTRERAGFQVRDVHHSHYGRICPIETPEGPNIGLIGYLATFGQVNDFGFIETPYRKVDKKLGRVLNEIVYLSADEEDEYYVAQANAPLDENGYFIEEKVEARYFEEILEIPKNRVDYMDVSPKQVFSVATALIPFLENDDANRALMGANMQRQAVPLVKTEAPIVGTGLEHKAARDSGAVVIAKKAGTVKKASASRISIEKDDGTIDNYELLKFMRSNQGTCYNQRPIVKVGERVEANEVIADGPSTEQGELALGRNVMVAFMPWEGYNYEDAILISEKLVKDDVFTSIHIEEYECEARDTKLGSEEITRDIPNVSEDMLKNLDDQGVIRVGAEVRPDDILVGKVTPKGETELTPEERLLRAIFGEKAREVRDSSLRVPHGEAGKVVAVKRFSREKGDELPPGVNQLVRVYIAQKRKISEGDKMAGRHGNKGVISRILPEEDMPFLEDGTPVEIVLNPLGVPSRMNIGQILECHMGWAARALGLNIATPVFDGANEEDIFTKLREASLLESGKTILFDGRTGEKFKHEITVGYVYMLKLAHLVDDKIHARSIGPYSLVTQQPLGGKAQFGGQRFGEMEVWALEAYGSSYTLQEILTVKSDDVAGRLKTYESIVKGENIPEPGVPEGFKVLIKELQSLALDVRILAGDDHEILIKDNDNEGNEKEKARELGLDLPDNPVGRMLEITQPIENAEQDVELKSSPK
ncbi:DNA-directed RNA polymerase subunit beta [Syntrophomonas wolfei]|uniref:DNA-directed RNA polymerase subunit beta n=1 Tax=Syntrophomonas wolfei subsp. wolfei (strain DSM 2245B / Goettingen) TaxID=335541 RepID=RPOB_SYNWW|nr:DNA-directed RNA polymerase subunit beta [Syntrophomonas wolfei]Q0AUH2.1 RecName: Full=DNA-directed RNA polymerase subunit beta; Short=RNAP subunit beta; AltName: Full=RNA polymerase subunit beta; AltName: Full=Transcriptase subunit beta [Syntrophomonas wolfei subsp. wolfei str. Goettingen G311]ABI69632.1 DNA-directed RNA polymerase [Syntrophomonas wolfei subsp. wolfei str. Goettingen G311]